MRFPESTILTFHLMTALASASITSAASFCEDLPKYATAADNISETIAAAEKEKYDQHQPKREPYPEPEPEAEVEAEAMADADLS